MSSGPGARDIVLIVDDSPETLSMLTAALDQDGATVLVAVDGPQALSLVERITPDIILMDAVMPGLDGFETCRRLKRNASLAHVPVIFMTGLNETEDIVKGLSAGGVDYVVKPIVAEELRARIRVHLANARVAQSAHAALDTAGRFLLAVDQDGQVIWSTPHAQKLLRPQADDEHGPILLPASVRTWVKGEVSQSGELGSIQFAGPRGRPLQLTFLGRVGKGEFLFRLVSEDATEQGAALRQQYALTTREAEVLVWLARGKSNRDIADILGLSPRTVNKHLEQVFSKLGVENRASATAIALRVLGG